MRVLLVKPQSNSDSIQPILGLGYLAAQLKKNQEVKILDCIKEKLPPSKFKRFIYDYNPEVVGIQSLTTDLKLVNDYLATIKKFNSNIITIIGGPHPSSAGAAALLDFPQADFAFQGEAEIGFPQLLDKLRVQGFQGSRVQETEDRVQSSNLENKNPQSAIRSSRDPSRDNPQFFSEIPGLIYRNQDGIQANPPLFIDNLDALGFPAWDLLKPQKYPPAPHGGFYRQFPVAPINISRGCPFSCAFCSAKKISGEKIRYRTVENVLAEIRLLSSKFNIREIHIIDDNFTYNREYVFQFCHSLNQNGQRITWTCPNGVRADTLDKEMLTVMKKSGCYALSIGIESGSDSILNYINKNISTNLIREKINLIRDTGIEVIGFFVLGFPPESREDLRQTVRFSLDLGLKRAQYILFHPFPGSPIYAGLNPRLIKAGNPQGSTYADPVLAPNGISLPELKNFQRMAFLKFYLRPRSLFNLIADIKSPKHLYYLIRRMKRWLLR
ncbi:MAG: radical SAM protein [Proteobacteria bacterium]|nr:radical SAM protein [Pseudomonadota bacterium]